MALAATVAFFFVFAIAADWLAIAYHKAREKGQVRRTAIVAVALEMISWSPVLAAVSAGGRLVWACAAASVIGSAVGTVLGMRRYEASAE
jgi:hypothetical protein